MLTFSFHNGNLEPELVRHQKLVFDKLGWPLKQIETSDSHYESLDKTIESFYWNAYPQDVICFFDIDCIPLFDFRSHISPICQKSIFGNVQKSSHIAGSKEFAAPSFFCISKENFIKIGSPSFRPTKTGDVGEDLSRIAEKVLTLDLLRPIKCEKELWPLDNGMFGYGTTFGKFGTEFTYHAFESNAKHGSTYRFIEKCNSILNT